MDDSTELVAGIDVGTQGARVVLADSRGALVAQASRPITSRLGADGAFEQDPEEWWLATADCLRELLAAPGLRRRLAALCVTATSGTVCLVSAGGELLGPAIMYGDRRAREEAALLNSSGRELTARLGYRFDPSFGLPKLLWLARHAPDLVARSRHFAHAGDVIVGRLTGEYGVSDWSQALKTGYDLVELRWPDLAREVLGGLAAHLPRVVAPGTTIGRVSAAASGATGLSAGLPVVAGMTDGCAAQIAGGAVEPGQWLSVLGTTLVIKGVTRELLRDPVGRIYSHRHPEGMWLPGGASNTGGEVLARRFAGADLAALDQRAAALTPSGVICYPLERTGERFPFAHADAQGFTIGEASDPEIRYAAALEGVAYLERLAYEALAGLGAAVAGPLRVAGGAARSRAWLQIRADVLDRPLLVPQQHEAAFGAAVLAAGASLHPGLTAAAGAMLHSREEIAPSERAHEYEQHYARFVGALRERGYLELG
jgi:D-ribulokinase